MTTLQPFSSRVIVTVRPLASVVEEVARAVPPDLLDDEDETLIDELLLELELECADAELPRLDLARTVDWFFAGPVVTSRPSARTRVTAQSAGIFIGADCADPATRDAAAANDAPAIPAKLAIAWLLHERGAASARDRAILHPLLAAAGGLARNGG